LQYHAISTSAGGEWHNPQQRQQQQLKLYQESLHIEH
jgi:hypothetical protein